MYNPQQPYFGQPQFNMMNQPQYSNNTPRRTEIIHVNGENGARTLQMLPNSQALLLDDTAPLVWLAQTDGAGYKTLTPYSITPYQPEPEIDLKDIDNRLRKIEEVIRNAKSNTSGPDKKSNTK